MISRFKKFSNQEGNHAGTIKLLHFFSCRVIGKNFLQDHEKMVLKVLHVRKLIFGLCLEYIEEIYKKLNVLLNVEKLLENLAWLHLWDYEDGIVFGNISWWGQENLKLFRT